MDARKTLNPEYEIPEPPPVPELAISQSPKELPIIEDSETEWDRNHAAGKEKDMKRES